MDIRQLRTFSCVAELGSLSKASDTLRVAQPALSRQIKLLEHELRAELFTRNGRGMVLTDAGRLLLARTAGIVRQIDQVRDEIQSAGGPPSGRVVLGLVSTKTPELESKDGLVRRIEEAAHFVPVERLAISPQCGFASAGGAGQVLTEDDVRRKVALLQEVAAAVWGGA